MKPILITLLTLLTATGILAQTPTTPEVMVLYHTETLPAGAEKLGTIKIVTDGLKTNCGYPQTMEEARTKARKLGGNLIQITQLKEPDGFNSCYRLRAEVYTITDLTPVRQQRDSQLQAIYSQLLPDTASYALVYTYRPKGGIGPLVVLIIQTLAKTNWGV